MPNRRFALSSLAALSTCGGWSRDAVAQQRLDPHAEAFRIPGEFEPTGAVWLGFDVGHKELTVALVQALSPFVKIKFLVSSQADQLAAQQLLDQHLVRGGDLSWFISPNTKYFLRDVTAMALGPHARLRQVSFRWSEYGLPGWCAKRYAGDKKRVQSCSGESGTTRIDTSQEIALLSAAELSESKLFLEGGALEVNGQGLIIANQSLLRQRNPGMSVLALEKLLLALPGVRKIIWLPEGLAEDPQGRATITGHYVAWGTGGHTDEFVRFADANTVLLAWPDDTEAASHPVTHMNRQRMKRNFDILSHATGLNGERLRIVKLPMPKIIERRVFLSAAAQRSWSQEWTADFFPTSERRKEGDAVMQIASASYMNFVIANGVVVVPDYLPHGTSEATQRRVKNTLQSVFKPRKSS